MTPKKEVGNSMGLLEDGSLRYVPAPRLRTCFSRPSHANELVCASHEPHGQETLNCGP